MKHDEFQVKGHRFGNEVRALLRVNLRGAFLRLERRWLKHTTSGKARFNHYNRHCLIIYSNF